MQCNEFYKFLGSPPPEGLGTTIGRMKKVADMLDDQILKAWVLDSENIELGKVGDNQHTLTVREPKAYRSENSEYMLARIKRDNPSLHQQIIGGDITIYQAGKKAGLVRDRVRVKRDPAGFYRAITKHLNQEQIKELISMLNQ